MQTAAAAEPLLLLDTCGLRASLALLRGSVRVQELLLPERSVSTNLLGAIADLLRVGEVAVVPPLAIGVVNGPGSFTGVRVGVAVAKGLAEAAQLHVAAVSRLEVLQRAEGHQAALAILWAGREQVYVRDADGRESMASFHELDALSGSSKILCAADELDRFPPDRWRLTPVALSAKSALHLVRASLAENATDLAAVDVRYVREEGSIYAPHFQRGAR